MKKEYGQRRDYIIEKMTAGLKLSNQTNSISLLKIQRATIKIPLLSEDLPIRRPLPLSLVQPLDVTERLCVISMQPAWKRSERP